MTEVFKRQPRRSLRGELPSGVIFHFLKFDENSTPAPPSDLLYFISFLGGFKVSKLHLCWEMKENHLKFSSQTETEIFSKKRFIHFLFNKVAAQTGDYKNPN